MHAVSRAAAALVESALALNAYARKSPARAGKKTRSEAESLVRFAALLHDAVSPEDAPAMKERLSRTRNFAASLSLAAAILHETAVAAQSACDGGTLDSYAACSVVAAPRTVENANEIIDKHFTRLEMMNM